jgi:hypothetical protein
MAPRRHGGDIARCLDALVVPNPTGFVGWQTTLVDFHAEYVDRYDRHRPHRSLSQHAPSNADAVAALAPAPAPICDIYGSRLRRLDVLCGLLHEYRLVT